MLALCWLINYSSAKANFGCACVTKTMDCHHPQKNRVQSMTRTGVTANIIEVELQLWTTNLSLLPNGVIVNWFPDNMTSLRSSSCWSWNLSGELGRQSLAVVLWSINSVWIATANSQRIQGSRWSIDRRLKQGGKKFYVASSYCKEKDENSAFGHFL